MVTCNSPRANWAVLSQLSAAVAPFVHERSLEVVFCNLYLIE